MAGCRFDVAAPRRKLSAIDGRTLPEASESYFPLTDLSPVLVPRNTTAGGDEEVVRVYVG